MQFFRISYFEEKDRYMNKNSPKKKRKRKSMIDGNNRDKSFFFENALRQKLKAIF